MNKTEVKAYNWLIKQGYSKEQIVYRSRKTPDFLTSDGRGFEAKKLYGDLIWFTKSQFEELKSMSNVKILVFKDDSEEPIAEIPSAELKDGAVFNGVRIYVTSRTPKTTLQVEDELLDNFQNAVVRRFGKLKGSQSQALAEAMRIWLSYVGEVRCVRVFGGGVDTVQELGRLPHTFKHALEDGLLEKSDVTAVPLFFRFTVENVESFCASISKMLNKEPRVIGRVEGFEGGGGISFHWQLTDAKRLVLNCFPDAVSVGLRVEEASFKDLNALSNSIGPTWDNRVR